MTFFGRRTGRHGGWLRKSAVGTCIINPEEITVVIFRYKGVESGEISICTIGAHADKPRFLTDRDEIFPRFKRQLRALGGRDVPVPGLISLG